jgi:hypothetical protein
MTTGISYTSKLIDLFLSKKIKGKLEDLTLKFLSEAVAYFEVKRVFSRLYDSVDYLNSEDEDPKDSFTKELKFKIYKENHSILSQMDLNATIKLDNIELNQPIIFYTIEKERVF